MRAVIGVGANLGDRLGTIAAAAARLAELPGVTGVHRSPLYETTPVGGPPQPQFLNGAFLVELVSPVAPTAIVEWLLAIEQDLGRVRGPERNAPRTLDLDLLWTDGPPSDEPSAIVPHPRLHERPFALAPLVDIVPDARDPAGVPYAVHLAGLDRSGIRRFVV
jgi:2-amino-4-hydroxy-6-hydroxymethyldihydropteridine diphosphokinase